jgi:hypothetical protein
MAHMTGGGTAPIAARRCPPAFPIAPIAGKNYKRKPGSMYKKSRLFLKRLYVLLENKIWAGYLLFPI